MKHLKSIYFLSLLLLVLSSCNSTKIPVLVATNSASIDKTPLKTTPLKEADLQRWSNLDLVKDTVPGMSVDKAYTQFLKGKKGVQVIVGVVDSGLDVDHVDLKGHIWVNKKEIPNNKIDDDKNGYVDDVNGWNFLGDATAENLELTRLVKKGDDGSEAYKTAKTALDTKLAEIAPQKQQVDFIVNADKTIRTHLKKEKYTTDDLKKITATETEIATAKNVMLSIASQAGANFQDDINDFKNQVYDMINYNLNVNFTGRKTGDNPDTMDMKFYGNGNVKGPNVEDALHGTHVAGIIAQIRGNKLGSDGVCANAVIMSVRCVPNGDEADKDIALGIRYAVDNGAKVINGSFGKDFSPHKEWVWEAIKYAESKDVLIVTAAGNDGKDIDVETTYPTDSPNKNTEIVDNYLCIGALNFECGSKLVASFSNFGSKNVDIYAPGMKIYATVPNNKYKMEQGTSMASPNVAGVAALIRSYYPSLTASQVKHIIMDSGTTLTTEVILGEAKENRPFTNASKSGKIVNAYNALIMAEQMSKK